MHHALPLRLCQIARWSALVLAVSLTGCAGASTAAKGGRSRGGGDPFLERGVPNIMTVDHTEVSAKDAFANRSKAPKAPKRVGDEETVEVRRSSEPRVGAKVIKFVGER